MFLYGFFDRGGRNIYHARLMFARPFIDSVDFARNGKEMRGEIAVSALSRLADRLANSDGLLTYIVRGYQEEGRDMLEVALQGTCTLKCQRCLSELEYPVSLVSKLWLLPADKLDEAEEDDDEMDAIEAEPRLDVLALIEEELLLDLPFAPRHPEGECVPAASNLQQKVNPFAVLAGLKK
ncbi:FIG01269488: protein, clustered with ribosomal protein L32p [Sideroxydans sp. CL21]|nr:FIG01269488: protein, clustered with ribosomal protein L32p [Sideroxydans sp. CL21]